MIHKKGERIGGLLEISNVKFGGYLFFACILGSGNFLMEVMG